MKFSAMTFQHACFISFPNDAGNASVFAQAFYEELKENIAVFDKNLSIFKWDQCEHLRTDDDWTQWVEKELCHSAMMVAVCAPTYFKGSPGCVSEFDGMELLATQRCNSLTAPDSCKTWIVGLRLLNEVPLPRLNNGYHVVDFFECASNPKDVRNKKKLRKMVFELALRIYKHWEWINSHQNLQLLQQANLCAHFQLSDGAAIKPDPFPHASGVAA